VRDRLNQKLKGWKAYFNLGSRKRAYGAIDECVEERARHFLRRRHQAPTQGTREFSMAAIDFYTYPDIQVICGRPQMDGDQDDIVLNPVLIAEVLSEPTRDYDRGEKFQRYQNLPSMLEYLAVAQDAPRIEHWTRQPDGRWLLANSEGMDASIQLASIDCSLPLAEIYDRIDFNW
jgi:Uma2 family endonuclease